MKNYKYDISVAYRIYPEVSRLPPIFRENKFLLSKLCLKSFKKSLDNLKVKFYAILDNCPPKYENLFKKYFKAPNLEIVRLNGVGNKKTFGHQLKILKEQESSDIVYFAEDDYYYLPNQFKTMIRFLKNDSQVHFITPYDHLDLYSHPFHNYRSSIKIFDKRHWRTVNSTCCTFLTTKSVLNQTQHVFAKYSKDNFFDKPYFKNNRFLYRLFIDFFGRATGPDYWSSLTKINVFKLFRILKLRYENYGIYQIYFRSWRYNWKQILFGKKWNLWAPMPTMATHMEYDFLSPVINWKKIFQKEIENLRSENDEEINTKIYLNKK